MKVIYFLTLLLFALPGWSQESSFTVSVSRDSILFGNYLSVTFTVENGSATAFEAPAFAGFNIIGGPNQSNSMRMINGKTTQSLSYTYYIEPKEEGIFYIEPASVNIDGEPHETHPLEIKVAPNPDGIVQPPAARENRSFDSFFDDPFFSQPFFDRLEPQEPAAPAKPKKKRKYYKI